MVLTERSFDVRTSRNKVKEIHILPTGERRERVHFVRLYTFVEIYNLLEKNGLTVFHTYGDFNGSDYELDSEGMIVVARK